MSADGIAPVSLWLLYEDELEAWRAAQSAPVADWLGEQNFKAEKHRVLLVPDRAGCCRPRGRRLGQASGRRVPMARGRACRASAPAPLSIGASMERKRRDANRSGICLRGVPLRAIPRGARPSASQPSRRRRMRIIASSHRRARRSRWRATGSTRPHRTSDPHNSRPPRATSRFAIGQRTASGWARSCAAATFPPFTRSVARAPNAPRLVDIRWSPPQADVTAAPDSHRQRRLLR